MDNDLLLLSRLVESIISLNAQTAIANNETAKLLEKITATQNKMLELMTLSEERSVQANKAYERIGHSLCNAIKLTERLQEEFKEERDILLVEINKLEDGRNKERENSIETRNFFHKTLASIKTGNDAKMSIIQELLSELIKERRPGVVNNIGPQA